MLSLLKSLNKDNKSILQPYDYTEYIQGKKLPDSNRGYFGIFPLSKKIFTCLSDNLWMIKVKSEDVYSYEENGITSFMNFKFHRKIEEYSELKYIKFVADFVKENYEHIVLETHYSPAYRVIYVNRIYPAIMSANDLKTINNIGGNWQRDILYDEKEISERKSFSLNLGWVFRSAGTGCFQIQSILSTLNSKPEYSDLFLLSFLKEFNIFEYLK